MIKDAVNLISIMLVDDEPTLRATVSHHLKKSGYSVRAFASGQECLDAFGDAPPDIVITDLRMPDMDGMKLLEKVKKQSPETDVIILTAYGDKEVAINALRLGAFDFFEKPISLAGIAETIKRTVRYQSLLRERNKLAEQVSTLSTRETERWGIDAMVGRSSGMKGVIKAIRLLQKSSNTSVLITGESGTGKELVARAIHFGSSRATGNFVPINCSAIPGELAESELFGHIKGSFTGATSDRIGCFERADNGTLLLDEIGDMPQAMQTKLLRVLETGLITPVGSSKERKVDVRILSSTNADLESKIKDKLFRSDLYFRLAGYSIAIPPLRERKADVPLLVNHFTGLIAGEMAMIAPAISSDALGVLKKYSFPGNVRELKNLIERALIECGGHEIDTEHLHFMKAQNNSIDVALLPTAGGQIVSDFSLNLDKAEQYLIKKAMARTDGNISAAAKLLGINRTKLHRKLHKVWE